MSWELDILNFIADNFHNAFMDRLMVFITSLGNGGIIWIAITAVLLAFKGTRRAGLASAFSLMLMLLTVNIAIKPLADRIRPFAAETALLRAVLVKPPTDGSFPSGHTAAGFASSFAVILCNKKIGMLMLIPAFLIGISRLYLCVHFPTDVVFGAVIGVVLGIIGYYISLFILKKYVDKSQ